VILFHVFVIQEANVKVFFNVHTKYQITITVVFVKKAEEKNMVRVSGQ
jgi:hypothetical protein